MSSQTVENARKLTNAVSTAYESHLAQASAQIDEERVALGAQPLEFAARLEGATTLKNLFEAFEASELALAQEVKEDSQARQLRNKKFEELYQVLSRLGAAVEAVYGRDGVRKIQLAGRTPRAISALDKFAQGFLRASEPMPDLPVVVQSFGSVDLVGARAAVAEMVPALRAAQVTLERDERETQLARYQRNKLHAAWYLELRYHIDLLRATLRRAGQEELAERILPSERQFNTIEPLELPTEPSENSSDNSPGNPSETPASS